MKMSKTFIFGCIAMVTACSGGGNEGGNSEDPTTFSSSVFIKTALVEPGEQCPNGGITVESGLDSNNNKILDADEIVETQIVCHGVDGTTGTNGSNGVDGSNGLNGLISVSDEPVGANCGAGGKKIDVGLDNNENNALDTDEITSTQYVCHGLAGTGGSTGNTDCIITTLADNSTQLQCGDQSVVLVPGNVVVSPTEISTITGGYEIVDSWQSSAGRNRLSFRNKHYLFDVTQDSEISIDITSNNTNYIYLINERGLLLGEVSNGILTRTVPAGIYTIVMATQAPNISETFTAQVIGNVSNPRKIDSDYLKRTETWANSAGRNPDSFRNHHYTFTVERDTYLDVILNSSLGTSLYLANSQGIVVASYLSGGLIGEIHTELPADTYTLVAGTHAPGRNADYTLELYGHFSNFTKVTSDMLGFQDSWSNSGGRAPASFRNDHYTVTVEQPTYLDILLQSSVGVALYLIDSQGFTVGSYQSGGLVGQVSLDIDPGVYTLVAATHAPAQAAEYTLEFFGHFTSITKTLPSAVTQITGAWVNSAGRVPDSFRNDHYEFTIESATYIDIIVSSSVGVSLFLIDSLGILQSSYASGGLTGQINTALAPDTYRLVVATHAPNQTAQYTLEMHGQYANFVSIPSQTLSVAGAWTSSGGTDSGSPDNPKYSITITEDSYIDILIESPADTYLFLIDSLGIEVLKGRSNLIAGNVEAGTYTIVAATWRENQTASFNLSAVGQVENLILQ